MKKYDTTEILAIIPRIEERKQAEMDRATNDIERRRILRRSFIQRLIAFKMYARRLRQAYERGECDRPLYKRISVAIGHTVMLLLDEMDARKVRLTENEYRTVFNIPEKVWRDQYGHRRPEKMSDPVFVDMLSDEPIVDFIVAAMVEVMVEMRRSFGN